MKEEQINETCNELARILKEKIVLNGIHLSKGLD